MARGTRAKLQVEGEKDFNESLRTMVAQLRAVNSELVLTAAKFEGQEKSVEALTASQAAYKKQSETLVREIALLEKGVQAAGEQFGENSREVADLQNKLNKAQTELIQTTKVIEDLNAAIENGSSEWSDLQKEIDTFMQGVAATDRNIAELNAQLAKQRSEVEAYGDSISKQKAQLKTLNDIYNEQQTKIYDLSEALRTAEEEYGENSKEVSNLKIQLLNAETALNKTASSINKQNDTIDEMRAEMLEAAKAMEVTIDTSEDFNDAVDSADEKGKGLGDVLDGLTGKFGVDLPENMRSTLNEMIQIDTQTLALVGGLAALATAIAKAERALIDITRESAAYADEILTMSTATGIATESLQEYTYAADLLDVSVETITGSQARLIRSMGAAQEGTAAQADAFAKLGVTYQNTDGSLRNAEEVFWDTIDALGQMQNETERDAIAMDLLGRSAQDLNPLIKAGSDRMAELADEAHEMGYVLDDEALGVLGEVDDAMQRLNRQTEATKNKVAVEFAPSLIDVTEKLTALIDGLGEALVDSGAVDAFGSILESAMDLIMPTSALSEDGVPRLTEALKPLAQMLALVADTMSAIAGLAHILTGIMHLDFSQVGEGWEMMTTAMGFNVSSGQLSAQQKLNYQNALKTQSYNATVGGYAGSSYAQYEEDMKNGFSGSYEYWLQQRSRNSTGNDNWRGGLTWVGENGPELAYFPRGTEILNATESREVVGGDTFYITIDAKNVREFNEIVRIAQTTRMNARKGVSG